MFATTGPESQMIQLWTITALTNGKKWNSFISWHLVAIALPSKKEMPTEVQRIFIELAILSPMTSTSFYSGNQIISPMGELLIHAPFIQQEFMHQLLPTSFFLR